jgi:hypothetical protein
LEPLPDLRSAAEPLTLSASRRVARRLIVRELHGRAQPDAPELARAMDRVCAPVIPSMRDAFGDDGCTALLDRAFAKLTLQFPVLRIFQGTSEPVIQLEHILTAIQTHGAPAVVAAIEELICYVADILTQLIGEEMALQIVDRDQIGPRTGDTEKST